MRIAGWSWISRIAPRGSSSGLDGPNAPILDHTASAQETQAKATINHPPEPSRNNVECAATVETQETPCFGHPQNSSFRYPQFFSGTSTRSCFHQKLIPWLSCCGGASNNENRCRRTPHAGVSQRRPHLPVLRRHQRRGCTFLPTFSDVSLKVWSYN